MTTSPDWLDPIRAQTKKLSEQNAERRRRTEELREEAEEIRQGNAAIKRETEAIVQGIVDRARSCRLAPRADPLDTKEAAEYLKITSSNTIQNWLEGGGFPPFTSGAKCPILKLLSPGFEMQKGELLNKMLVLATNAHAGQYDKGGKPYILHPLKVMHYLKTEDEELQCIALGHDVIEDTKVTYSELRDLGLPSRVIEGIRALTKVPGETYDEYKHRVFANEDAMRVKLCDLRHNTDIRRLKGVTEKDIARIAKYQVFYLEIQSRLQDTKSESGL